MKLMSIILYVTVIAALEGALYEYLWWTASHTGHGNYETVQRHQGARGLKKESTGFALEQQKTWPGFLEQSISILQALWTILIAILQWIWHGIREWIEIVLMIFECTELIHKMFERFH